MIALRQFEQTKELLAAGEHSQRRIAQIVGIGRATVAAIAKGYRPDFARRQRVELLIEPSGPPVRCRGCGGMVYAPCRLCLVRRVVREERDELLKQQSLARRQALRRLLLAVWRANASAPSASTNGTCAKRRA